MSSTEPGLSSVEAARRLDTYGPNEPAPVRRLSALVQLLHLFANPLVLILLVASAIAGSLGQQVDAILIVTMVVLGVSINFWQSYRSQQAAERLRSSVIPTASVLRDGAWVETPLPNVVPGDVFRLSAGDLVPADAYLLESRDLSVQQAMLTGESLPADKIASAAAPDSVTDPNAPLGGAQARWHYGQGSHRRQRTGRAARLPQHRARRAADRDGRRHRANLRRTGSFLR